MKIEDLDKDYEIKLLQKELDRMSSEIKKLTGIIKDNDLEEELGVDSIISAEEEICVEGINQILERVRNKTFDKIDITNFDILNKNLRLIKGKQDDKRKTKPSKVEDLLKIVQGDKK